MDTPTLMHAFEEILDPSSLSRTVDLNLLRSICSRGIPSQPPWIRPRVWKLLLGTLPPRKDEWPSECVKSRQRYYDLATQFLEEVEQMPEPSLPLSPRDKLLDTISKDVDRTQPKVPFFRAPADPSRLSPLLPLPQESEEGEDTEEDDDPDKDLPPTPRIESADALFRRLELIHEATHRAKERRPTLSLNTTAPGLRSPATPEIRLSPTAVPEEEAILSAAPKDEPESRRPSVASVASDASSTLMTPTLSVTSPTSNEFNSVPILAAQPLPPVAPKHNQILLRILYLYSVVNPHQPYTQGLNELLAPLYYALCAELDPRENAHAEADAFWLFTELIGEMGSVVGDPGDWQTPAAPSTSDASPLPVAALHGPMDGVRGAMNELSNRLKWADIQLWEDLARKSLDPKMPYYSYRWIACLLAQDLPLPAVLTLWDSIFAQPPSTPDENPRLSFVVDLCASLLIRIRTRLIKTGNSSSYSGGLWGDEYVDSDAILASKDPTFTPVMGEGFVEGMTLLQAYPLKTIGVEMIIEGAYYLINKRKTEEQSAKGLLPIPAAVSSVGSALSQRIWNGITNNVDAYEDEEEETEDTGDIKSTAVERKPESTPVSPSGSTTSFPASASTAASKWLQYAESFKDSDTAASLSKASTNLTVVAMDAWKNKALPSRAPQPQSQPQPQSPEPPLSPPPTGSTPVGARLRQYAEAFKSSDTAASLSKVSTNWTAAAIDRWNKPAVSSSLNPTASPTKSAAAPLPETPNRRGNSISGWTGWGAKAIWGPKNTEPSNSPSPQHGHTPSASMSEPGVRNWGSPHRETRSSLPVPLPNQTRDPSPTTPARLQPSPSRSPHRSPGDISSQYIPPPRPQHFAKPRDSIGYHDRPTLDVSDPLLEALRSTPNRVESIPDENGMLGTIQSAIASLSGSRSNSRTPSPPPSSAQPKSAPRPLLLGTAAAKTSPGPRSATPSGNNGNPADSRPSSVSSNASVHALHQRSATSNASPASAIASATSAVSARPWTNSPRSPSDSEGGFVPLRNGVGVNRQTGSAALVRKSRAAQPSNRHSGHSRIGSEYQPFEVPALDSSSTRSSPPAPDSPLSATAKSPTSTKKIQGEPLLPKKWALIDKPILSIDTPVSGNNDGYSSMDSNPAKKEKHARVRSKRSYQPKTGQLRVATSSRQPPPVDEFGVGLHPEGGQVSDGPLTPRGIALADDMMKTPTSAVDEGVHAAPIRMVRSPGRRAKKTLPKEEKAPSPIHPPVRTSVVLSEEEGVRADDEEGYEDLLSAYSEDDEGKKRSSLYA
ncbi:hypothetical protein FRC02_000781 [Tulasnella sp. 418]|nr:hypothetical protein FRC02_000781 [Tulasnella sp. 418]